MKTPVNHEQNPAPGASSKACDGAKREADFKAVWMGTHPDFRGKTVDGSLSLMSYAKFGSGLVSAATIKDEELAERLAELRGPQLKIGGAQ